MLLKETARRQSLAELDTACGLRGCSLENGVMICTITCVTNFAVYVLPPSWEILFSHPINSVPTTRRKRMRRDGDGTQRPTATLYSFDFEMDCGGNRVESTRLSWFPLKEIL